MSIAAVLGTGTMGAGMARSLLRESFEVRVWNRTPERAKPLAQDGAAVHESAADAVRGADAVIVMVFDADAALEVLTAIAPDVGEDTVILQCSTIGPPGAQRVAEIAADRGLRVLDCPVLGTKGPAEAGTLVVLASGDPRLRRAAQPVFDAIGSKTVWAGDRAGDGSALKLVGNSWVAGITLAAAQAVSLAQAQGLDPQLFLDAIQGGASDSPYAHVKGGAMIDRDFPPSFALDGIRKDIDLMRAAAAAAGIPTANLDAVRDAYAVASEAGHGSDDIAAVFTALAPPAPAPGG